MHARGAPLTDRREITWELNRFLGSESEPQLLPAQLRFYGFTISRFRKFALEQLAQYVGHLQPALGAGGLDPAVKRDRHVDGEPLHRFGRCCFPVDVHSRCRPGRGALCGAGTPSAFPSLSMGQAPAQSR